MDDQPLNLAALDPARDPGRWRAVMEGTMGRVDAALLRRRADPLTLIAAWRRPLLAAAAAVVLVLVTVEVGLERREARGRPVRALADVSAAFVPEGRLPTAAVLVRAMTVGGEP